MSSNKQDSPMSAASDRSDFAPAVSAPAVEPRPSPRAGLAPPVPARPTDLPTDAISFIEEPDAYSFFQMVVLADRYFNDRPPAGSVDAATREALRFRAVASLGFPPADIATMTWTRSVDQSGLDGLPRLLAEVAFLGLYGPASPLPPHYTEKVMQGDPAEDSLRDFLDLFNHRLVGLLHRCWKKYRYYIEFKPTADDNISTSLFALLGRQRPPGPPATGPGALDWSRLLPFAGALALNCRSPKVLANVVAAYFDIEASVEEMVERTVIIPEPQQNRLGRRRVTLDDDWVLGEELPDVSGKFRVWIGPLEWHRFQTFLPNGPNHRTLFVLIRYLARNALDFDVWVRSAKGGTPELRIGGDNPMPLGWGTWLGGDHQLERGVPLPPCPETG